MKQSKSSLFALCLVGTFLMVYGTAVILRLVVGNYLFDGGLTDFNYLVLALLCVMPFLIYLLLSGNHFRKAKEVILASWFFFLILFIYVNFMLVFASFEMPPGTVMRLWIVFPITAFLLVCVLHVSHGKNMWWKETKKVND